MDVIDRLIQHDEDFARRLFDSVAHLPNADLDKPVLASMPLLFGEHPITLREILEAIAGNKGRWVTAIEGGSDSDGTDAQDIVALQERLDSNAQAFRRTINTIAARNGWDDGFIDATCSPPESFTYGGMLAHVVTFSVYRRTLAILALRELGVTDLGIGDPLEWERDQD